MLPSSNIDSLLQRELDSLPLPPEEQWFPRGTRRAGAWSIAGWAIAGTIVIALAFVAGPALRDWRDTRDASAARPTPPVLPTVVGGHGIAPLPNEIRNTALGYNIVLPANWRESARWSGQIPGDPSLIGRATYTARTPQQEEVLLARDPLARLPWDLTAELWASGGLASLDWARLHGGCAATCIVDNREIHGVNFLTTVDSTSGLHAFYVSRGDRLLVFSYVAGTTAELPAGVTVDTLPEIVMNVGLP
jgi:hypothetical protein